MKQKILATGLSGLVGSRIRELLDEKFDFEELGLETGFNITRREQTLNKIIDSNAPILLHLAAKADVDGCEGDKERDLKSLKSPNKDRWEGENSAWAINVWGTKNIVEACQESRKKIIYISTDFVFDGENPPKNGYTEEDRLNPINWYGRTKFEGEKIIQDSNLDWVICRLSFPYRAKFELKKDFLRAILDCLEKGEEVKSVSDQLFTPTFIDDIASALNVLIESWSEGIYHVVGSSSLTPYEATLLIAKNFGYPLKLVKPINAWDYFRGRAPRPFKLALSNDKIGKLGVKMASFEEGLEKVKEQASL